MIKTLKEFWQKRLTLDVKQRSWIDQQIRYNFLYNTHRTSILNLNCCCISRTEKNLKIDLIFTNSYNGKKDHVKEVRAVIQPYAKLIILLYNCTKAAFEKKIEYFTKIVNENLSLAEIIQYVVTSVMYNHS